MLVRILLLALAPGVWAGMYGKPVINLDAKTFKQAMSVEHASMVAFVAPWCGHCKALAPEYTSAASSLSPLIPFYAVDCDDAGNKQLCAQHGIQGFPTIKAFPRALKGAAKDYAGGRKAGELVEYAKTLVPDRVKKLRVNKDAESEAKDGNIGAVEAFLKDKKDMPHILLVHPTQPSIPFLWKVLGHRLSSKASMGYVRDTPDHAIISSLGVYNTTDGARDPIRALFWAKGVKRLQVVEFEGAFKFNALLEWALNMLDTDQPTPAERVPVKPAAVKAQTSPAANAADGGNKADASEDAAEMERQRRAKLKAKMEEAERRDQARRDKLAAKKAAEAAAAAQAEAEAEIVNAGSEQETQEGEAEPATPVDAPPPQVEESVEDEMLEGESPAKGTVPQDPVPEEAPEDASVDKARETRVHEEL